MRIKKYTVFALCFCVGTMLLAQSPFLDPTFGVNGRFTYNFTQGFDRFWCTALQADGKILGGGHSESSSGGQRASLLRIHPNGSVDATFANGGAWISDDPSFGFVTKIIVQPDGKILLSGRSIGAFKVVRLLPNGDYDPLFGSGGKVTLPIWTASGTRSVSDMQLQPNGKILISGSLDLDLYDESMIARIRADGSVDGSFGAFGAIKVSGSDFNGGYFYGDFQLVVKSDNKILAAITVNDSLGYVDGYVLQYSVNGKRDTSFGENGWARIPSSGLITGLFALPDDRFYVLADYYDSTFTTGLYKFKANGIRDSTFAVNGVGLLPFENPFSDATNSNSGYLQADGKVVVFGGNVNGVGFLGRYNQDGFPDMSFGNSGTIAPETSFEIFYGGFTQPDGKIVAVGRFQDAAQNQPCSLVRYLGSNSVGVIDAPAVVSSPLIYPNPIVGQTFTIAYELPTLSPVEIELLNIQGKKLGTLLNEERPSGKNEASLVLPSELVNGFYLLNIRTNRGNSVVKLAVQR
jgi:uncharacterized delta-60 repeat protein